MASNMLSLKTAVGLTKFARPAVVRVAQYSWEPKEVETHTGQVSRFDIVLQTRGTVTRADICLTFFFLFFPGGVAYLTHVVRIKFGIVDFGAIRDGDFDSFCPYNARLWTVYSGGSFLLMLFFLFCRNGKKTTIV